MKFIEIDVRSLEPPEPMTAILSALSTLPQDKGLLVHHSRQPFPLYHKLKAAGWDYRCESKQSIIFCFRFTASKTRFHEPSRPIIQCLTAH